MSEPIAYLSGRRVPVSEAKLSIFDQGVVQGASVTEMIRTFAHRPFRLDAHLDRLEHSLQAVRFELELTRDELQTIVHEIVEHNARLIPESHDLGIIVFVTAGTNLTYVGAAGAAWYRRPTVCVHTFPLPFELWAEKSRTGQHLATPAIRHMPPECMDPTIKSRSRLHFYLADEQARQIDPFASALLLDLEGRITETTTGNFFIVKNGAIRTPTPGATLTGVSQQVVCELAAKLGIAYGAAELRPDDVLDADEAFTSSTPYCLLPVTRLNNQPVGTGAPGPTFGRLVAAWNELVGLDIVGQLRTGAAERTAVS